MFTFMKMSLVLPLVNGVTSCKLFHKKDKWHNWSKLYYSWIKLTILFYFCSSKIFFVAPFSVTVDGRDLIFGHKLHIGTPYRGKHFWTHQIPTSPGTYRLNTMDKTDIVHELNQYVEKLNIVLKTFKKTTNIGW
jgi:hypothetical protein